MFFFRWLASFIPEPDIDQHLRPEDGETVEDRVPHHPVVYVRPAAQVLGAAALGLWGVFVSVQIAWLWFLVAAGLVVHAAWLALVDHMDRFVVTNQRVFRVTGVLAQKRATMPLRRILDITVEKPLLGRVLGYGHLVFESAAQEQGLRAIRYVGRPDDRDRTIQGVVQNAGLRGAGSPALKAPLDEDAR